MVLPTISILQIGDVHWPELRAMSPDIQVRDSGLSPGMIGSMRPAPSALVQRGLLEQIDSQDAILFVGDLTSQGALAAYQEYLDSITNWFDAETKHKVFIVPGNHDISHNNCDDNDVWAKFRPLNDALAQRGFQVMADDQPLIGRIDRAGGSVLVVGLNSCIGCGEKKYFNPDQLSETEAQRQRLIQQADDAAYKRLNTPVLSENQLHEAMHAVKQASQKTLSVVLAHHNLLPQAFTSVSPYSEILNAGQVRARLTEANRPLLYLHGHIHSDPIEILTTPTTSGARVVSISAPTVELGFNVIRVEYSSTGYPLGCRISKFRRDTSASGDIQELPPINVPFWQGAGGRSGRITPEARGLFSELLRRGESYYCSDILREMSTAPQALASQLLELEWMGLIRLEDTTEPVDYWTVRRLPA